MNPNVPIIGQKPNRVKILQEALQMGRAIGLIGVWVEADGQMSVTAAGALEEHRAVLNALAQHLSRSAELFFLAMELGAAETQKGFEELVTKAEAEAKNDGSKG